MSWQGHAHKHFQIACNTQEKRYPDHIACNTQKKRFPGAVKHIEATMKKSAMLIKRFKVYMQCIFHEFGKLLIF